MKAELRLEMAKKIAEKIYKNDQRTIDGVIAVVKGNKLRYFHKVLPVALANDICDHLEFPRYRYASKIAGVIQNYHDKEKKENLPG